MYLLHEIAKEQYKNFKSLEKDLIKNSYDNKVEGFYETLYFKNGRITSIPWIIQWKGKYYKTNRDIFDNPKLINQNDVDTWKRNVIYMGERLG